MAAPMGLAHALNSWPALAMWDRLTNKLRKKCRMSLWDGYKRPEISGVLLFSRVLG